MQADFEAWRALSEPRLAALGMRLEVAIDGSGVHRLRDEGGSCYTDWVAKQARKKRLRPPVVFPLQIDIFPLVRGAGEYRGELVSNPDHLANHAGKTDKLHWPREWLEPGQLLDFEGFQLRGPPRCGCMPPQGPVQDHSPPIALRITRPCRRA